ncbi:hypothetical protein [Bowmanella dokdonensis]|uniref:Uncharacterized protein n=1 Tax=Bowmanella dokdonensis TaxID=751969 RepID=A0A939IQQ5_9ALTE|nr:hypothetical protein [Bowmanella dokdonensis]MBN7824686.1 hypothetical protein [Bowmanella dokdonensis]
MKANIIDEEHISKVGGIFEQEAKAKQAIQSLMTEGDFRQEEVNLVPPGDKSFDEKIETDDLAVKRTLLNSHIILGLIAVLVGLGVAALLVSYGPAFTQSSPMMTFIALGILSLFLGMMLAGFISLRPDEDRLVNKVRKATLNHRWVVVVQAKDKQHAEQARNILKRSTGSLAETF